METAKWTDIRFRHKQHHAEGARTALRRSLNNIKTQSVKAMHREVHFKIVALIADSIQNLKSRIQNYVGKKIFLLLTPEACCLLRPQTDICVPNLLYHHSPFHRKTALLLWHIACSKQLSPGNREIN